MLFSATPYSHIAEVIFVGDPMCSWCYGFTPELKKLRETLKDIPFELLMGGLRDGDIFTPEKLKNHLGYWEAVHQTTGLPFDATALSQEGFNYTTEPACRAVVSMQHIDEDLAYPFYIALQNAFYAQGEDITQSAVITKVAETFGIKKALFLQYFESEAMHKANQRQKQRAQTYGVSSFPTLIIIDKEGHMSQIRGYKPYEALIALLRS